MKLVLLTALVTVALSQSLEVSEDAHAQWEMFKMTHKKEYGSKKEEEKRRSIFFNNFQFVQEHNEKHRQGLETFVVATNKFADMSNKEFNAVMNGYRRPAAFASGGKVFEMAENLEPPKTVDWRQNGAVTPVKDQGQCGSCYAYSTTGSVEGASFLRTGRLVSLSEQNLVDCSRPQGNQGCDGGLMTNAFKYIEKNGGINPEESYPYKAKEGPCQYDAKNIGANITGYMNITSGSEKALQQAVGTVGPVSVAIDASPISFQLYSNGFYQSMSCSSYKLNHAVLAVGYGTENNLDYWIVKNSWGTGWGMKGNMMLRRNHRNMCGIASMASFPTV